MGRWFKRILVGMTVLTAVAVVIKKLFAKKQNHSDSETKHEETIVQGMRVIENPFDEKDPAPQEKPKEVVVVNKEYHGYQVYKNDIWVTVGIIVVIVAVIILSLFAYNSRIERDNAQKLETVKADSTMMHSLNEIKFSIWNVSESLDSLDLHVKDGTKAIHELKESIENANVKKGKKQ